MSEDKVNVVSKVEIIELSLIVIISLFMIFGVFSFPTKIVFYQLVLVLSVIWFLQSLLRDVCILYKTKNTQQVSEKRIASCFCIESTIGILGVLLGIVLSLFLNSYMVELTQWHWIVLVTLVLIMSFLTKDYVIELKSFRIYKEKNHMNIIFGWKNT